MNAAVWSRSGAPQCRALLVFGSSLLVICLSQPPSLHCQKGGVTMRKGAEEGLESMRRHSPPWPNAEARAGRPSSDWPSRGEDEEESRVGSVGSLAVDLALGHQSVISRP
ncbi:hypothetical protein V8C42DRAFT_313180 [Trichoderma barbatum]